MYVYNPKFVPEYTPFTVDGKTKDAWTVHDYGNGRTYRLTSSPPLRKGIPDFSVL